MNAVKDPNQGTHRLEALCYAYLKALLDRKSRTKEQYNREPARQTILFSEHSIAH